MSFRAKNSSTLSKYKISMTEGLMGEQELGIIVQIPKNPGIAIPAEELGMIQRQKDGIKAGLLEERGNGMNSSREAARAACRHEGEREPAEKSQRFHPWRKMAKIGEALRSIQLHHRAFVGTSSNGDLFIPMGNESGLGRDSELFPGWKVRGAVP